MMHMRSIMPRKVSETLGELGRSLGIAVGVKVIIVTVNYRLGILGAWQGIWAPPRKWYLRACKSPDLFGDGRCLPSTLLNYYGSNCRYNQVALGPSNLNQEGLDMHTCCTSVLHPMYRQDVSLIRIVVRKCTLSN